MGGEIEEEEDADEVEKGVEYEREKNKYLRIYRGKGEGEETEDGWRRQRGYCVGFIYIEIGFLSLLLYYIYCFHLLSLSSAV